MEANVSANCSAGPMTSSHLIYILGSLGAVSVVTCLVALFWLFCLKLHRQFIYRLASYQVMAALFHAILTVCQFSFLEYMYNDSKHAACAAVGYLFQIAAWIKICFGCWVTFHLFCFAVFLKNMRKLEPFYVISSILFPIAISSVPLITKSYGPTGEWCWIQRQRCGKTFTDGDIERLAVLYVPAFVTLVLQSIAILIMMITVYYRAHRKPDENMFGRDQNRKAFRQLLPLVAYPILFCILTLPPLIDRAYGFFKSAPNEGLLILLAICIPAWSLSAGVTLIVHIGALKRADIMSVLLSIFRAKDTLQMNQGPTDISYPSETSMLLTGNSNKHGTESSTHFSIPSDS